MTRIFVGNLPENTNEDQLHKAFSNYGEVTTLDIKTKANTDNNQKKFAFITLSASNNDIERCIKNFSSEDFNGNRLYVTRARESFLERLQKEREQGQRKSNNEVVNNNVIPPKNSIISFNDNLNVRKRKISDNDNRQNFVEQNNKQKSTSNLIEIEEDNKYSSPDVHNENKKKLDSDKKRLESMKKKRQEFKEKQMIIKTGLVGIDKIQNKKIIFSNDEDVSTNQNYNKNSTLYNNDSKKVSTQSLFNNEDDDDEINFGIKEQFEGVKGQKILELQSTYKSDKRFVLDKRFIEDGQPKYETELDKNDEAEPIDIGQSDEKLRQLNILQDLLGVPIKSAIRKTDASNDNKKTKVKMGMLRFDPKQPEHAKFLVPVENPKPEVSETKRKRKEKNSSEEIPIEPTEPPQPKIEVSQDQYYKVSDTLKEAIAQSGTFSLRSLFAQNNDEDKEQQEEQDNQYIPLKKKKESKVKNPLAPVEKNPFKYDSSDSDTETEEHKNDVVPERTETKAVWKEKFFFSKFDYRFKEALTFFNNTNENEAKKERRELKTLMKKRLYNNERKHQIFQKKIGGRRKRNVH